MPSINYSKSRDIRDQILAKIEIVELISATVDLRRCGKSFTGLCPFHDDHNPSLSVDPDTRRFKCFACDAHGDIFQWVMLTEHVDFKIALEKLAARAGVELPKRSNASQKRLVDTYNYTNEAGEVRYQILRYEPKTFRPKRPDGKGGYIWNLDGVERVPFRLPEVLRAVESGADIWITEGEKDALALVETGVCATTTAGGANAPWLREYTEILRTATAITIVAHADGVGYKRAQTVRDALVTAGVPVRVVKAKEGNDAFDHLGHGHGIEDFIEIFCEERQRFGELVSNIAAKETGTSQEVTDCLLNDIVLKLEKYVVFVNTAQVTAVALWLLNTHVFECFDSTPYLNVSSATKQSGKSRLFEVMERMAARPWIVVEASEAILFRKIESSKPTLLLDEIDAMFGKDSTMTEGIRAVLNAGYRRGTPVPRCVGPNQDLQDFSIYCPKAFAGIGAKLPDTVLDRSIPIALRRRAPSERMPSRFRQKKAGEEFAPLHLRIVRWSKWAKGKVEDEEPELPEQLSDRQQDCWEPLFAIADLAGGNWPQKARSAAIELHGGLPDADVGVLLLSHCREARSDNDGESISTEQLLTALVNRGDDSPWARWWSDDIEHRQTKRPGSQLARKLKPYEIEPQQLRIGSIKTRGYRWSDFEDSWNRYLPQSGCTVMPKNDNGTTVYHRSEPIFTQTAILAKSALELDCTVVPLQERTEGVQSGYDRSYFDDAPLLSDDDYHPDEDDQ